MLTESNEVLVSLLVLFDCERCCRFDGIILTILINNDKNEFFINGCYCIGYIRIFRKVFFNFVVV